MLFLKQNNYLYSINPITLINQNEFKIESSIIIKSLKDIEQLEELYIFENPPDVRRFLWKYKFLIEILFEAQKKIIEIFGNDITLYLELHRDPEENWEELFIIIKSLYSAEKAIELEKKFFEEFVYRIDAMKGKLNIIEEPNYK